MGAALGLLALTIAPLSACRFRTTQVINLRELERAPAMTPVLAGRAVVSDGSVLREFSARLGARVALVQIHSTAEWSRLKELAPELTASPDFSKGIVVGVASQIGEPVDGVWPISVDGVQVFDGAGLLAASFRPDTYLPDGATYLETAFVEGLATVLVVDVNGERFYPD